jgi:GrpB-like predicted nucleotidyltransferase (UPF0157 family)
MQKGDSNDWKGSVVCAMADEADLLGVKRHVVKLVPYREEYKQLFEAEKLKIAEALGENALHIHHVGSTSIPGAIAKPLLDIAVAVKDLEAIHIPAMEALGYQCMGEYGIPGRCYFVKRRDGDMSTHHVHCYEEGHEGLENQLLFRDYLRAHPEAVQEYNALKMFLLETYPNDRPKYTESKTGFVLHILALAKSGCP